MANRVVMDADGLKISRPGVNVLTAGPNNLLMDTSSRMLQVVDSGIRGGVTSVNPQTVSFTNLGYTPLVYAYSSTALSHVVYLSSTSVSLRVDVAGTHSVYWVVFNVPRDG